jgi:hypothetical protein
MTHQIQLGLRNADAVVQAFADASMTFDAQILNAYLDAYPEHADRLKSYAQVWLISSRASTQEIWSQAIPDEEMLRAQSRLLMVWEQACEPSETDDVAEAARRLDEFAGEEGLRVLTRSLLKSEDESEDILVVEYLDPGLKDEPASIRRRLAESIRCPARLVPNTLARHREQPHTHFSAKDKPECPSLRTWAEAVKELPVSEQRKAELLRDD